MNEQGITLSTVAVGRHSDTNLLERLANQGGEGIIILMSFQICQRFL